MRPQIVNKTGNTVYDGIGKDERRVSARNIGCGDLLGKTSPALWRTFSCKHIQAFEEMKKLEDEMEAKRSEETGEMLPNA